ncbi:MAG TPA: saccharopine dehydrogenase C-terminal domain-containing protein [Candidatus Bathyarchaeia archaeon]|nr:saccharopine dehydrogenase C-terminal domain-containing protein [Candidatus Bathyarchaeia archaeon]
MKILIFGGTGKIGSVVAWDLVGDPQLEQIGIVGRNQENLDRTGNWLASSKVKSHLLDVNRKQEVRQLIKQYDAAVICLPDRRTDYQIIQALIEVGKSGVDVLEEYHRRPDPYETEGLDLPAGQSLNQYGDWLHRQAVQNGVTIIDGIGFAPGLSNITVNEGINQLDEADSAVARVGGIPSKKSAQNRPLKYMITWAFGHVLREYMVKVKILKNGKPAEVEAMEGYETFKFEKLGKKEELECFITPGMPSFLYTRSGLKEFAEKTIRWPGHWQGIKTLKKCGLLDLKPVEFNHQPLVPREFLVSVLEPRLRADKTDGDVCVMWNTVKGKKNGKGVRIDYYMWEKADTRKKISAMSRVTAFPAAIAVRMLAAGKIKEKGIVTPENCLQGEIYYEFMNELRKRKIKILEEKRIG